MGRALARVGSPLAPGAIAADELMVLEEAGQKLAFFAREDAEFVFGAANHPPYPLMTGYCAGRANKNALALDEARTCVQDEQNHGLDGSAEHCMRWWTTEFLRGHLVGSLTET